METKAASVEKSVVQRWMGYDIGLHLDGKTVTSLYYISGVLMVMAVGVALRLWNLGSANLWTDEAWTADRVHESLRESLSNIMAVHNHGPAYFLLLTAS